MRFKKFELFYGGFSSTNYQVTKCWNKLVFHKWDYHCNESAPVFIRLHAEEWANLALRIRDIVSVWDLRYDSDTCDGTQWTLVLKTDTEKYNFYGSNNFPTNFDELILLIRRFGGIDEFAFGHLESDYPGEEADESEEIL